MANEPETTVSTPFFNIAGEAELWVADTESGGVAFLTVGEDDDVTAVSTGNEEIDLGIQHAAVIHALRQHRRCTVCLAIGPHQRKALQVVRVQFKRGLGKHKSTAADDLERGQTWMPHNGDRPRQIVQFCVSTGEGGHKYGETLVQWSSSADKWGNCSVRAFLRWIAHTGATLA